MTKHIELLNTQNSVEKTNTNNKLSYERKPIANTPFWVTGNEDQGYHIIMGKYRITPEPLKTQLDAEIWLETHKWDVTLTVALCAITDINDIKEKKEQLTNKTK